MWWMVENRPLPSLFPGPLLISQGLSVPQGRAKTQVGTVFFAVTGQQKTPLTVVEHERRRP
jgi:hypothetical protein